ncbi:MAG: hypothetical protein AAF663_01395 [Planctomycetota bacterium]
MLNHLNRTFLVAAAAVATVGAATASAATLVYEPFAASDYTVGNSLSGANPTVAGFGGAWVKDGGGDTTVETGSLTYLNLVTSGNKASSVSGGRMNRSLDVSATGPLGNYVADVDFGGTTGVQPAIATSANGNALYISMLVSWSGGDPTDAFFGVEFHNPIGGNSDSSQEFRFDAADGPDDFQVDSDGGNNNFLGDFDTDTHLLVFRIDFADGDDTLTWWWDPTSLGGAEPAVATGSATFELEFDKIVLSRFAGDGSVTGLSDEFRIGTTYASVTPVPEPTAVGLGGAALALLIGRRSR